jgi:signal transduction histidine kinase
MDAPADDLGGEIKRLQRCLNDLVSVLALPAIWTGREPSQIVSTLLDALLGMLRLDLVYVRLEDRFGGSPVEMVRVADSWSLACMPHEVGGVLDQWLGHDSQKWPSVARHALGDVHISIVPLRLGLQGDIGLIVTGSQRADFPSETERLLLSVAANQASIGLHEARLLSEQKRVAVELERRVAQRTAELATANEELRKEVAERKLADAKLRLEEKELRRSEALLAESQRLSATGSFLWRVATDEITWSDQSYRIFQIGRVTPVTFGAIKDRVHPEDLAAFTKEIARARSGPTTVEFDFRLQMPDHSVRYLHVVAHSGRDENGQLEYTGAVQDVTDGKLSDEALGKARSELAHVARVTSLGALTASIAHEVSQPLSGIITNASTCLRMLAADPPNVDGARETARRTIRDGNRASEVITRLRALFSKKDAATDPLDLNDAVREVVALSVRELQNDHAVVQFELAEDLPLVMGDRVQLQQVVLNLLLNAADAMKDVEDRPRYVFISTARDEDNRVRLTVRDTGVGIETQRAEKLFEAFYSTKSGGMGIGLSVSRSIVENHHGRLWATANDGPGATFALSIPCGAPGLPVASSLAARWAPDPADALHAVGQP